MFLLPAGTDAAFGLPQLIQHRNYVAVYIVLYCIHTDALELFD